MSCNFMSSNFTPCYSVRHFHVHAFSCPATWSVFFMSCNFMSCNFDGPSFSCPSFSVNQMSAIYWNSIYTSGFDFDHHHCWHFILHCSLWNFIQIGSPTCRLSRRGISAILDFRGPVIGSSKSPCTTRSSALNCLVFEKKSRFCIWATDRQTDRQTDGQLQHIKPLLLSRARRLNNKIISLQF